MKICGIYKITSPSNKIYIGQSKDILKRFSRYKTLKFERQRFLYHSIIKYGFDNHKFEILEECLAEKLNYLEKHYVDLYQTFNSEHGLNLKDGGGAFAKYSDETRKKMSLSMGV